jgi:hypothetical protein
LSSVAACTCEQGYEAVNSSDLVEHLIGGVLVSQGGIGLRVEWETDGKKNNKSNACLEIEETEHRAKRPWPEFLLKSKFH